jgi:hypothetical protein
VKILEKQPISRPSSRPLPENDQQQNNLVQKPSVESSSLNDDSVRRKMSRPAGFSVSHPTAAPTPGSVQLETARDIAFHEMRENKAFIGAWEKLGTKGRPFFFVADRLQKTANPSGPMMEDILKQELMANFSPFRQVTVPNVDLYYKKADSERIFSLGSLAKAFTEPSLDSFICYVSMSD